MNDFKFAFRQLLKNRGFTAVAVLTLALGIGANTAIFSFVSTILLRPLPFQDSERLVMVYESHPVNGWLRNWVAAPMLAEWRKQSTVFEGLGARTSGSSSILTGQGPPETLPASRLSANVLALVGVKPLLGRDFLPEEEIVGQHHVVLLSYELWQRRFGGNPKVVGQSVTLDSEPKTIIGIMPPRTHFPERDTHVWLPLAFQSWELQARHAHNFLVYGKLKPGISLEQANAEMKLMAERLAAADEQNKGWGAVVHPLHRIVVEDVERMLLVLLGSVALVLLIACANIANLWLARSTARAHEFAIRAALGAGRGRLIRQLLTESLLLFVVGGLGGVLLAAGGLETLMRFSPPDLPRIWEGIRLDGPTLIFTAIVTLGTAVFFGLAPAWQASNPAPARVLTESSRGTAGVRRGRLRGGLVISEVALSVILLIGAGLMIRSFSKLLTQKTGFNPEQVVTMNFNLPRRKYSGPGQSQQFFDRWLASVRALPGVQAAGGALGLPLGGWGSNQILEVVGAPTPAPGEPVSAGYSQVSPGYFAAMNIPLLQGRDFDERDTTNTTPVLIVDETFVRKFKLGTNVLGRRIKNSDTDRDQVSEIIGVVQDVKRDNLAKPPTGEMYRSYKQVCWGQMTLAIRTPRETAELTRAVRAALDQLDKDLPIENVRTLTELVASSVAQRKLSAQLLSGFAVAALLLAGIGLYGVLAYTVTQRTREIGIRAALGAQRRDVLRLVVGQGMRLALAGLVLGLAGAFVLTRSLQHLLFETEPTDPLTFVTVPLLLVIVAVLACVLPARRAAGVNPMEALRCEG
ncbi:MAG: ABC transporter permease [Verrucomicrobiales bacterium]|nr:ABC transporter permease [Verrucomicrobiales bacterium]